MAASGVDVNLLIPMAGEGSRFAQEGFTKPKPLIDVAGKPMIKREHDEKYNIKDALQALVPGKLTVVYADKLTEGAACTCLLAEEHINNDVPLVIANSDQFMEWDSRPFYDLVKKKQVDGSILSFHIPMDKNDTKWSYAKVDEGGFVTEVAEKIVISEHATVGVYHWTRGSDYVAAARAPRSCIDSWKHWSHVKSQAKQMIAKDVRVKGEFYVCPVYNENVANGQKFVLYPVDKFWGLGVPTDLEYFFANYPPVKGAVVIK